MDGDLFIFAELHLNFCGDPVIIMALENAGNQSVVTTPKCHIIIDPIALGMAPRKMTAPTTLADFLYH